MASKSQITSSTPTYCFQEWLAGLTDCERNALSAYKDNTENLKALILGNSQSETLSSTGWIWKTEHLDHLDAAISRFQHRPELTLWCAVADGQGVINAINGDEYRYQPYISTSRSKEASYSFFRSPIVHKPFLLEFNMDRDFCGAQLPLQDGIGDGEYEIVLPRNRSYRVISNNQTIPFSQVRPDIARDADKTVTVLRLKPM